MVVAKRSLCYPLLTDVYLAQFTTYDAANDKLIRTAIIPIINQTSLL